MRYKTSLAVMIIVYCFIASALSILRFKAFNAGLVDLGRFEQALWSIIHGKLAVITFEFGNASRFIVHFEPILFLLSPFYYIFQKTEFLLIAQSLALGLAAIPLYQICKTELESEKWSLIISFCYLVYPTLFYINNIDFHPDSFAVFFTFSAFYFMLKKNWKWFFTSLIFLLAVREYFGLIVAFWGIFMLLRYRDKKRSFVLIALGLAWFLFSFIILPKLFPQFYFWSKHIGPLSEINFKFQGLAKNLTALLLPVAFLPLLQTDRLLIGLPILAGSILAGQFSYGNHHIAGVIPFIFIAAIGAVGFLKRKGAKNLGLVLILASIFSNQLYGASPFSLRFFLPGDYHYWANESNFKIDAHDRNLEDFIRLVPKEGKISVSNHIGAHLARREYVNFYPFPKDIRGVDYVLIDLKTKTDIPWLDWDKQLEIFDKLTRDTDFVMVKQKDQVYLFVKKKLKGI